MVPMRSDMNESERGRERGKGRNEILDADVDALGRGRALMGGQQRREGEEEDGQQ